MKRTIAVLVFVFLTCGTVDAAGELLVADFNAGEPPTNIGGDYGTWSPDPEDESQGCYYVNEADDFQNAKSGYCIRLDYDVQSKNPAFNGFWMKLKGVDISGYDVLSFWVRGAADGKFTKRFKVELKDSAGKRAIYPVQDIAAEWKEVTVDLKSTKSAIDWTQMAEFVIVFDDLLATYKEGSIFIDQVVFKKR